MIQNFYIHIPFCRQKCSYCNFSTIQNSDNPTHEKYFFTLKNEIKNYFKINNPHKIKTIYFWWWTPSAIDTKFIWDILDIFKSQFWNLKNIEILLESNPEDLSWEKWLKKLAEFKKIWITKISIWIQSFQEKFFNFFERKNYEAEKIILNAKKFFPNLSIDLIFWIPNQTEKDLIKDLEMIKKLNLKHISYYALDYKKKSKIEKKKDNPDKKFLPLDFKIIKYYYFLILDFLKKENFHQYEFYNFCKNLDNWKKIFWSEKNFNWHNKNFWELENYTWFWISAVWSDWDNIFTNTKNLKKYFDSNWNKKFFQESEKISWFEKNFLELQKIFHLTRWKNISEIEKILEIKNNTNTYNQKIILEKILKSKFIKTNIFQNWKIFVKLNNEWIMLFEDFFEEIFD